MTAREAGFGESLHRQERMYLLREGHFIGFGMGLLLSRWWWAAVAWGAVLLTLWGYSLWAIRDADIGSQGGSDV